jgi:hypothetical protein
MRPDDSGQDIGQVDAILAKFPGPVTLHLTLNRRLLGLLVGVCGTALFVWFWMTPNRYRSAGWFVEPLGILVFAGLSIRAVILLIFPAHASLTLDADGFTVNHVFHRIRRSWREVGDFNVETRHHWRSGEHRHVVYGLLDGTARGAKKKSHIVPEFYGRPRLHGEVLAWLMNEWRGRALALPPETSVPVVARAQDG